jgi:quercetin dioxygenase-like cupin family protein
MAMPHLKSGEVMRILPFAEQLNALPNKASTQAFFKDPHLEVIRVNLAAGKRLPSHHVAGPITVQCLEGQIHFYVDDIVKVMQAGDFLYLKGGVPHAVLAITNASFLVTVVLLDSHTFV